MAWYSTKRLSSQNTSFRVASTHLTKNAYRKPFQTTGLTIESDRNLGHPKLSDTDPFSPRSKMITVVFLLGNIGLNLFDAP